MKLNAWGGSKMATILDVKKVLDSMRYSDIHDYIDKGDYIHKLGLYLEDIEILKERLPQGWYIEITDHNEDTDWCRVHIKQS
jgi:hypothetical protein